MNKEHDLFNNPMTNAAMKALSDEDIMRYKELGQELYGNIDFEGSKVLNNMPAPMAEAIAYINESLKSGLHPSALENNEKDLLSETYGDKWYLKWGYVHEDLNDIITLK